MKTFTFPLKTFSYRRTEAELSAETQGVSWDTYFTEAYYRKEIPVWERYAPGLFSDTGFDWLMLIRVLGLAVALGMLGAVASSFLFSRRSRKR